MSSVKVLPVPGISGEAAVPGDKSISHRAAILSAVSPGISTVTGFLESEDCVNTLRITAELGAVVNRSDGVISITGCGGSFRKPARVLDCGNSGTGMRLLAGLLAGQPFESTLTGDASLRSRPMKRIKTPLELMGAELVLSGEKGCAPLTVKGSRLRGIRYELPVASAQVKSCVLLAGLFADGQTTVVETGKTRDHTERMFADAGVDVVVNGPEITIPGRSYAQVAGRDWIVPGDISSAAFWMVCAAVRPGSRVRLLNVGLNPRRTAVIDVLARMGAGIKINVLSGAASEPFGDVTVSGSSLSGTDIGGDEIPNLIDEIPVLAVAAAMAGGRTVIKDAHELRVKESDRIAEMVKCLRLAGVDAAETDDGMVIEGSGRIKGGVEISSMGDHRVAMSMSIAGLCSEQGICVCDTDCVLTSYPSFWSDMDKLKGGPGA